MLLSQPVSVADSASACHHNNIIISASIISSVPAMHPPRSQVPGPRQYVVHQGSLRGLCLTDENTRHDCPMRILKDLVTVSHAPPTGTLPSPRTAAFFWLLPSFARRLPAPPALSFCPGFCRTLSTSSPVSRPRRAAAGSGTPVPTSIAAPLSAMRPPEVSNAAWAPSPAEIGQ